MVMTVNESNGYIWDADWVLDRIINDRGQNRVLFINGILVDDEAFENQYSSVENAFGLEYIDEVPTSIESFQGIHNTSKGNGLNEAINLGGSLAEHLFKPAVEAYREYWKAKFPNAPIGAKSPDGIFAKTFALLNGEGNNYGEFQIAKTITLVGSASLFTLSSPILDRNGLSDFVAKFGDLQHLDFGADPPTDLVEAVSQYFYKDASPVSKKVNDEWTNDAIKWLKNNPNDSLIIVAHSQGNFFIEDGFLEKNSDFQGIDPSRIKIISLGSPTDYSSLTERYTVAPFINSDSNLFGANTDPVTRLQFPSNQSDRNRLAHLLEVIPTWTNLGGYGSDVLFDHDLGKYLDRTDVKDKFEELFYQLNPQGYYFSPLGQVTRIGVIVNGSEHGDYIEGNDGIDIIRAGARNDVVHAKGGDDKLIGGSGYDFLDGGLGFDTADYSDSPNEIVVEADHLGGNPRGIVLLPGSDIYRVKDGFGQEDILVDIEEISGSNHDDKMYGGQGTDIFYGQKGNDYFEGKGGNDKFYGGDDNDTAYGGTEDDELRGEGGNDTLYGGDGNDKISGGRIWDFWDKRYRRSKWSKSIEYFCSVFPKNWYFFKK